MKGTIQQASSYMLKAICFILVSITLVATLMLVVMYQITYPSRSQTRELIDYMENVLSSKCLVYEESGVYFKGIMDKTKLDSAKGTCIEFTGTIYTEIIDQQGGRWSFGSAIEKSSAKNSLQYPLVIKYADTTVPALMEVRIQ